MPVLQSYTSLGYWVVFLVAFFEAFVFIGSFIPGTFIIIFYGFLAAGGYFNLGDLIILSVLGAVLGDGASFYLGTKSKGIFHKNNFLFNTKYLAKSQKFFDKHGDKSIFSGRFIGVIKPFVPFVAGLSGMNTRKFIFWNIFSAIIWALAHLLAGYFFGGAFKAMEIWITRIGAVAVFSFLFLFVLWFSIKKGERALEYTVSFIQSTGWSFVNSFPVRWFYHKFPRVYNFILNRIRNESFWGLPFSLLVISFLLVTLSLWSLLKDVLTSEAIVHLDMKLENFLVIFRDSFLIKFFLGMTALAEAQVIISIVLAVTAIFWIWKKRFYILSLWVAVAGSAISAYLIKMLINRTRPGGNIPVYTEHFFSFPSGHSALIITLLGFLTYCIWRNFKTWKIRVNSFFITSALIILVGFSRLYLGLHFLSDVLGGYLIGFLWLLWGIALSEWLIIKSQKQNNIETLKEINDATQISGQEKVLKLVTGLIVFAEIFFMASFVINFKPIFNTVTQTAERQILIRDISDPLFEKYIPKFPENLTGDYKEPLNFIIITTDDKALTDSITMAGWLPAEPVSIKNIGKMFLYYFNKQTYDSAPVAPLFWHGRPNDFAFEKIVSNTGIDTRYKVRFWKTDIATEDGGFVYVGATNADIGVEYAIFPIASTDLDIARDVLFKEILNIKKIASYEKRLFVDNSRGNYYEKGKYITDGKAYVIYLK